MGQLTQKKREEKINKGFTRHSGYCKDKENETKKRTTMKGSAGVHAVEKNDKREKKRRYTGNKTGLSKEKDWRNPITGRLRGRGGA